MDGRAPLELFTLLLLMLPELLTLLPLALKTLKLLGDPSQKLNFYYDIILD